MGTIFTGVGLLAVLAQLRSLLQYIRTENRRWKERTAGAWASCIMVDRLPSNGIQEDAVPVFSGWLQNFYLLEKIITVSQDDRELSGKSSWSNLFARMDIKAVDLDAYGGLRRQPPPRDYSIQDYGNWTRALRPGLGDALVNNGSISYGFSAAEFAALIIICGFSPRDFHPKSLRHSSSYYGQIVVAEHDNFSQIAKFDSHHGFRDAMRSFKTDMCDIPVAHSLDLAFGMIRAKGRHGRKWIIPRDCATFPDISNPGFSSWDLWGAYASARQLQKTKYSFQRFVGIDGPAVAEYCQRNDGFEADDIRVLNDLMSSSGLDEMMQLPNDDLKARARAFLNATHAMAAIQPWGLLPILPGHLVNAIKVILNPFYKTREFTIDILQRELKMIARETFRPEGRNGEELSHRLESIVGSKDAFFEASNHGSQVSIYHEAMALVFHHNDIRLDDVRISLAAAVGSELFRLRYQPHEEAERFESFRKSTQQYLERCYGKAGPMQKSRNVPGWAVDVYGNYLWGWVTSSKPADPDLISYFRRRVFLA